MKINYKRLILGLISLIRIVSLTGCSSLLTSKMPTGNASMQQSYDDAINGSATNNDDSSLYSVRSRIHYASDDDAKHLMPFKVMVIKLTVNLHVYRIQTSSCMRCQAM